MSTTERVGALLDEMTLEEKIAQLVSVWVTDFGADFAPQFEGAVSSKSTVEQLVVPDGLGQITRAWGTGPISVADGFARLRLWQSQVVAQNRLEIPALVHEECLTGLNAYGATTYPAPLAWASTFDPDLIEAMGSAIGRDMAAIGIHQGLAPVLDVVRDYRWGRVEETMGEDPYVVGSIGSSYVRGLESAGIIATLKHFAGYAASRDAKNHGPVSIGPRELIDLVLPPFEHALRIGGARSVMNAYNDMDGIPAAASHALLTELLRDRWGFEGTVVSDYWAIPFLINMHRVAGDLQHAAALALDAGIDVELPDSTTYGGGLAGAVRDGLVSEAIVDRAVTRHLRQKVELGLLDGLQVVPDDEDVDLDSPANHRLAATIAEESVVLVANDGSLLPLGQQPWPRTGNGIARELPTRIAVIGPCADEPRTLMGCYSFPNHVLFGKGSELGIRVPSIVEAIRAEFPGVEVVTAPGANFFDKTTEKLEDALALAATADLVVAAVGDLAGLFGRGTSGEGCDVDDLILPGGQDRLLTKVLGLDQPTVTVVVSGRPYALGAYESSGAVIQAFFPGEEGAQAIAGLLSGRVQPSGRLPVQLPGHANAVSSYLRVPLAAYIPGISVLDPSPWKPFGHGITASPIEYRSIALSSSHIDTAGAFEVEIVVENVGTQDAVEVVQLYQSDLLAQVARPLVQLLGFARVSLAAGTRKSVVFEVDADTLSFSGREHFRVVEPGEVVFSAGPDASQRPLHATLTITGTEPRRVGDIRQLTVPWTETEVASN